VSAPSWLIWRVHCFDNRRRTALFQLLKTMIDIIAISEPTTLAEVLVEQIERIYVTSFPPSERIPLDSLIQSFERGERRLLVAELNGRILGFAFSLSLPSWNIQNIEYLAVDVSFRNQHVGSKLLQSFEERALAAHAGGIILEVENDDEAPMNEIEIRKRRIQFYERNGYHLVECAPAYRVPDADGAWTLSMKLMWRPLVYHLKRLQGAVLRAVVSNIFQSGYGLSKENPMVQQVLRGLIC